jgi:hypothetical protein
VAGGLKASHHPNHGYPLQHCHRGEGDPRRPLLELARRAAFSQFPLGPTTVRGTVVASSRLQVQSANGAGAAGRHAHLGSGAFRGSAGIEEKS